MEEQGSAGSIFGSRSMFSQFQASGAALGPTRGPNQWLPEVKRKECEDTSSVPSIAMLRTRGTIPPLLNTRLWHCGLKILRLFVYCRRLSAKDLLTIPGC